MKKLFSKIDNTSKEPNWSYLGKVFVVGRHTVTVEEVLAEGTYTRRCLTSLRYSMFVLSLSPSASLSLSLSSSVSTDPSLSFSLFLVQSRLAARNPLASSWPSSRLSPFPLERTNERAGPLARAFLTCEIVARDDACNAIVLPISRERWTWWCTRGTLAASIRAAAYDLRPGRCSRTSLVSSDTRGIFPSF